MGTEKGLVPVGGGALAGPGSIPGLEGLDLDDLQLPRWRLLQPTSAEAADHGAGVFVNTITGEVAKSPLHAVPVRVLKQRLYFKGDKDDGGNRPLSCRSMDGRVGIGDPGGECGSCPLSQWGQSEDGDAEAPPCFKVYGFLVLRTSEKPGADFDAASLGVVSFYRTSETAGKAWASDLWMNAMVTKEPWRRTYAVKTVAVKGEKGLYYQMKAGYARAATEEERAVARTWAALTAGKQVELAEEPEAE